MKKVSGVEHDLGYAGPERRDDEADANLLVGKDWGSGSLFAAYSFQKNDDLFGRDRKFVQAIDFNTGIPIGRQCNPGNVSVGTTNYALPGLVAGIGLLKYRSVSD